MAFPSEANILRRTLTAFASLVSSLKNRQWGLIRDPSGNYTEDGYSRNSGSMLSKDEQGRVHEFWERKAVVSYVDSAVASGLSSLAATSAAGLQVGWTSVGVEWAHFDSATGEFDSWTATPSGNYDFFGSIEYAIDAFGSLLIRGAFIPPFAVSSFDPNNAGLMCFRITNALIDSGVAGYLGRFAASFVTAVGAAGSVEPLWLWKSYCTFESSNAIVFRVKDDTNGGAYQRFAAGQSVFLTRPLIPQVAPVAISGTSGSAGIDTEDSDSVSFSGDGQPLTPLSAEVIIDTTTPGNSLSSSALGLYASGSSMGNFRVIATEAEFEAFLTEVGNLIGLVSADITLPHGAKNYNVRDRKKLYFGSFALHNDSAPTFTKISGDGVLYFYSVISISSGAVVPIDSSAMLGIYARQIRNIGLAAQVSASGWTGEAMFESLAGVTASGEWMQGFWDDTSGDSKVAADSLDGEAAYLADKLCDSAEAAFPVVVVGGVRKVKIPSSGAGIYSVANWAQLKTALEDSSVSRKFIFSSVAQISAPTTGTNAIALYGLSDLNFSVFQGGSANLAITALANAALRLISDGSFYFTSTGALTTDANSAVYCRRLLWGGAASISAYLFYEECLTSNAPTGSTRSRWFSSPVLAPSGAGLMAKAAGDAVDSFVARSIAVAANSGLSVAAADGAAGNPTISLAVANATTQGAAPATGTPAGKFLRDDMSWQTAGGMSNPMTAAADLIIGGAGGAPARLAAGTAAQVLTMVSGAPAWAAASSGASTAQHTARFSRAGGISAAAILNANFASVSGASAVGFWVPVASKLKRVTLANSVSNISASGIDIAVKWSVNNVQHAFPYDPLSGTLYNWNRVAPSANTYGNGYATADLNIQIAANSMVYVDITNMYSGSITDPLVTLHIVED